jgi:hypothetical protein
VFVLPNVLPISEVFPRFIGDGKSGKVTQQLRFALASNRYPGGILKENNFAEFGLD